MVDLFVGKMLYIKIIEGVFFKDKDVFNINKNVKEKIVNIYILRNSELVEIEKVKVGDIVVIIKVNFLKIGDIIFVDKDVEVLEKIDFFKL